MDRWKYGVVALAVGAMTLIIALLVIGWAWDRNEAALASITGSVGTIIGAYFGLQVGGAEAEDAVTGQVIDRREARDVPRRA